MENNKILALIRSFFSEDISTFVSFTEKVFHRLVGNLIEEVYTIHNKLLL